MLQPLQPKPSLDGVLQSQYVAQLQVCASVTFLSWPGGHTQNHMNSVQKLPSKKTATPSPTGAKARSRSPRKGEESAGCCLKQRAASCLNAAVVPKSPPEQMVPLETLSNDLECVRALH